MTQRRALPAALAAAALVAAGVAGGLAGGSRPAERTLVVRAVRAYVARSGCCATGAYRVGRVEVARSDPSWARTGLFGWEAPGHPVGGAEVILHRVGGRWQGVAIGTDSLGCAITSAAARREWDAGCPEG